MDHIPAFGFETDLSNGNHHRSVEATTSEVVKFKRIMTNTCKILGYIPLIGLFVGIYRIHEAKQWGRNVNQMAEPGKKWNHILRGSIEVSNLGILLLIPDVILTIYRERKASGQAPCFG